jgi:hypothetical protein
VFECLSEDKERKGFGYASMSLRGGSPGRRGNPIERRDCFVTSFLAMTNLWLFRHSYYPIPGSQFQLRSSHALFGKSYIFELCDRAKYESVTFLRKPDFPPIYLAIITVTYKTTPLRYGYNSCSLPSQGQRDLFRCHPERRDEAHVDQIG